MDLMFSLQGEHWQNKGEPGDNPGSIEGYSHYTLVRMTQPTKELTVQIHLQDNEKYSPHSGSLMYLGSKYNPLKGTTNAYLRLNGDEIIGIIVEDDWVERKHWTEVVVVQEEQAPEKADEISFNIMSFVSDLDRTHWCPMGTPARKKPDEYRRYRLLRMETPSDDLTVKLHITHSDGDKKEVFIRFIESKSRSPLRDIGSCFLKVEGDDVTGIIVEDDWAERK